MAYSQYSNFQMHWTKSSTAEKLSLACESQPNSAVVQLGGEPSAEELDAGKGEAGQTASRLAQPVERLAGQPAVQLSRPRPAIEQPRRARTVKILKFTIYRNVTL
jgi:hypothetical protein